MATGYGDAAATRSGNGIAIAGLVCGIVGIFLFNIILGPLALIFGGVGLRNAKRSGAGRSGMAISAIVLGVVDIVLFVVLLALASSHGGSFQWHVGG
ncbi:DUF4190 domain-containing protein [Streptacidiphilus sp. PAMC 29251]